MHKKDLVGGLFVIVGALITVGVLLPFFVPDEVALLILKLVALSFGGVVGVLLLWIGVQLLLSPPPKPLKEIEKEIEKEVEEIKKEVREMLKDRTED